MKKPSKPYLNAYSALYGDTPCSTITKPRSSNRQKRRNPERNEQIAVVDWLTKQGILHYAIPNGGRRSRLSGYLLKLEGMKAGVPDICVPLPRKGYGALYIEMKAPTGGVVSDYQQRWIKDLTAAGNLAVVCYSYEEAVKTIEIYLDRFRHER